MNIFLNEITDETRKSALSGIEQLTPREKEVMRLLVDGKTNKEVARTLDISPRTAEVHRSRVVGKLGTRNVVEMTRIVTVLAYQLAFPGQAQGSKT